MQHQMMHQEAQNFEVELQNKEMTTTPGIFSGSISNVSSIQTIPVLHNHSQLQAINSSRNQESPVLTQQQQAQHPGRLLEQNQSFGCRQQMIIANQSYKNGAGTTLHPLTSHRQQPSQEILYSYRNNSLGQAGDLNLQQQPYANRVATVADPLSQYLDTQYANIRASHTESNHNLLIQQRPRSLLNTVSNGGALSQQNFTTVPSIQSLLHQKSGLTSSRQQSSGKGLKRSKSNLTTKSLPQGHNSNPSQKRKVTLNQSFNAGRGCISKQRVQRQSQTTQTRKAQGQQPQQVKVRGSHSRGATGKYHDATRRSQEGRHSATRLTAATVRKTSTTTDQQQTMFPPLNQSLTSYLKQQTQQQPGLISTRQQSQETLLLDTTRPKSVKRVKTRSKSKLGMSTKKSARSRKSTCSQGKRKKTTPTSALRRSATSTQLLKSDHSRSNLKSTLRLPPSHSPLPQAILYATHNSIDTHRKSLKSRCSACHSADDTLSATAARAFVISQQHGHQKIGGKGKNLRRQGSHGQIFKGAVSQIDKLRERHHLLKQFNKQGETAKSKMSQREIASSGNYFTTSNFDDQNHTATFKGSRKALIQSSKSSIDFSNDDKRIVNILTQKKFDGKSDGKSGGKSAGKSARKQSNGKSARKQRTLSSIKRSRTSSPQPYTSMTKSINSRRRVQNNGANVVYRGSLAQTSSQQYLNSSCNQMNMMQPNNNMHASSNSRLDLTEPQRHVQSYMNTLGQTGSNRLSPSADQHLNNQYYGANSSQANMPLPQGLGLGHNQFSIGCPDQHSNSIGVSDHQASLISTKENVTQQHHVIQPYAASRQQMRTFQPTTTMSNDDNTMHNKSLSQLSLLSTKQNNPVKQRLQPKIVGDDLLSARTRQRTPTAVQQLTARDGVAQDADIIGTERTWNSAIDALENMGKRRIANLRTKLAQIIDANSKNVEGANQMMEKSFMSKELAIPNEQAFRELIKVGINSDQERLIGSMQAELVTKDKLKQDYQSLKYKYLKRKDDWARQLKLTETKAKSAKDLAVAETNKDLQKQINFYRAQAEDLSQRMRHEVKTRQHEIESAVQGGQGYRQALIQTEGEVRKMQDQVLHLNQMLSRSDTEIDRYREQAETLRQELQSQEIQMHKQADEAVKSMKILQKDKYKKQIESLESINCENLKLRVEEAKRNADEMHQKDLDLMQEKFDIRLKAAYINITEHEDIVRQLQARERDIQSNLINQVEDARSSQIAQVQNEMREYADAERHRMQEVIRSLEEQLQETHLESKKALENKDRAWQEMHDMRTQEAIDEAKTACSKENQIHQQLLDSQHEMRQLETEVQRLKDDSQSFAQHEEAMLRDIEQLNNKLDDQIRSNDDLQGSVNKVRELKDAIKLLKQENSSLDSLVKSKDALVDRVVKDSKQLKKRITWVTQLKQSQVRNLKADLQHLKRTFADDLKQFQAEWLQKSEPMLSLARQLNERILEKNSQLENMSQKFESVLKQLDQASKTKDTQQKELREIIEERDQFKRQIEKQHNDQSSHRKETKKVEKELNEVKTRSSRLDERVNNLNKIIENLEFQVKESQAQSETAQEDRLSDLKQHELAMADKEKKLQEFFCTKLDRKMTRLNEDHKKAFKELTTSHESQIVLFEQEFQSAQARIQDLERQLVVAQSHSQQQRQRTREREALLRKQTQKIEYEVSKSIEKALGRSASRKNTNRRQNHISGLQPQQISQQQQQHQPLLQQFPTTVQDPYLLQTPNLAHRQNANTLTSNHTYGSRIKHQQYQVYQRTEDSPNIHHQNHNRVAQSSELLNNVNYQNFQNGGQNSLQRAFTQHALSPPGQQALHIQDLQQVNGGGGNGTASFVIQGGQQTTDAGNYRYATRASSNSYGRAAYPRSKSTLSHQNQQQQSLIQLNSKAAANQDSSEFDRENLAPPTLTQIVQHKQSQLVSIGGGGEQEGVFNPLLTIKPNSALYQSNILAPTTTSQHQHIQQFNQHADKNNSSQNELISGGNLSREAISRSFETKLLQNNNNNNQSSSINNINDNSQEMKHSDHE